jgi:hypothetical protein
MCPVKMIIVFYSDVYYFLSYIYISFCQFADFLYQLVQAQRLTWHIKTQQHTQPLSFFSLLPFFCTIYLTRGYVRLWYSKSSGWEMLGRIWSWKQFGGFLIGVAYSVGGVSLWSVFLWTVVVGSKLAQPLIQRQNGKSAHFNWTETEE